MNDQQLDLDLLRQRLIAMRQELASVKEIGKKGTETVELDQTRMGRLSRMDAMQAQAISVASKNRREAQLREIDAALKRIDEEDFGACVECGEQIDRRRLIFDPATLLCITCAEKAEQ